MKIFKSKTKAQKIYLIIMENLINNKLTIDIKYDLKGSLYGRTARSDEKKWDRSIALKDLDFLEDGMKIVFSEEEYKKFKIIIEKDCEFLKNNNIIDYSLFVAIHWIPKCKLN
jgi:1-phosphatidylinositol-4-phosphate 5-kinase